MAAWTNKRARLVLAVAAVCVALLIAAARSQTQEAPAVRSPHWTAEGCASCHRMENGKPTPIAMAQAQGSCVKCHDGSTAAAEAHPVGRALRGDTAQPGAGWPLLEGKMGCLTCHDARAACTDKRPEFNTAFLRNPPTDERPDFCRNCHRPEQFPRVNPHAMLKADRSIDKDKCLICHQDVPDTNVRRRSGRPQLRAAAALQCATCHARHRDPAPRGHMGAVVGPDMQAYLRARELVGLTGTPPRKLVEDLKAAGAKPQRLIPDENGRMTCTTCHNPHQAGTFVPGSDLNFGAIRIHDGKTISPVRGQTWCNHCHQL